MTSTTSPTRVAAAPTPPLRRLWQVPAFFLGLLALVGTLSTGSLWRTPRVAPPGQAVRELRGVLARHDYDQDKVLSLLERALREADAAPDLAAEAHFLAGSAYVALAEKAGPNPDLDAWGKARAFLERADAGGVAVEDVARLRFRLAKARVSTEPQGAKPVLDALAEAIEEGADGPEDAVRGYALLAQSYLRLPQPDVEAALAATEKQLRQPIANDALLAPARLARGELLLRLRRGDEARQVLRNVGPQAPPAVTAQARLLVARSLETEEQWAEAAVAWRETCDDAAAGRRDRHAILYHLGLCHRNAGQKGQAVRAWDECVRLGAPADETTAAALALGELSLREGTPAEALAAFERAVRDVATADEWRNPLVGLARAREAFEAGCRLARERAAFDVALQLATLYERLAPPARAAELQALASEAWGRARREQARGAKPEEAAAAEREADALLVQAARASERAAAVAAPTADQAERLWRAALLYGDGHDARQAAEALERFLTIAQEPDLRRPDRFGPRLGEGWYRLAEARRALRREDEALKAFEECLAWDDPRKGGGGRFAFRARNDLALAWKARGRLDDAQDILEQNLQLLRDARDPREPEAKEKTLFALGDLYFERRALKGELAKAIHCLEGALEQFPASPEALVARYELAESYRLLADDLSGNLGPLERLTVESRLRIEQEVGRHRDKAMAHYQELTRVLQAKATRDATEEILLSYAQFKAADSRFLLGDYDAAFREYEALAERYRGRVEHYHGLVGIVRASDALSRSGAGADAEQRERKARKALQEIRAGMKDLDPKTRSEFESWLEKIDRAADKGP